MVSYRACDGERGLAADMGGLWTTTVSPKAH